jgi:hypothetical protein
MPPLYDRAVADGKILVGVDAPRDVRSIERALATAGAQIQRTP